AVARRPSFLSPRQDSPSREANSCRLRPHRAKRAIAPRSSERNLVRKAVRHSPTCSLLRASKAWPRDDPRFQPNQSQRKSEGPRKRSSSFLEPEALTDTRVAGWLVARLPSTLEQRFGAATLSQLCRYLCPHSGDFTLEFGDIGLELRDAHQA